MDAEPGGAALFFQINPPSHLTDMPTDDQQTFRGRLEAFVLFHLGVDAEVRFEAGESGGVSVSLSHSRVRDFGFRLDEAKLSELAGSPDQCEEFLLDQLTQHRRGGLAR